MLCIQKAYDAIKRELAAQGIAISKVSPLPNWEEYLAEKTTQAKRCLSGLTRLIYYKARQLTTLLLVFVKSTSVMPGSMVATTQ